MRHAPSAKKHPILPVFLVTHVYNVILAKKVPPKYFMHNIIYNIHFCYVSLFHHQDIQRKLSECSEELKIKFGPNPDMWAETSRVH